MLFLFILWYCFAEWPAFMTQVPLFSAKGMLASVQSQLYTLPNYASFYISEGHRNLCVYIYMHILYMYVCMLNVYLCESIAIFLYFLVVKHYKFISNIFFPFVFIYLLSTDECFSITAIWVPHFQNMTSILLYKP